MERIGENIYNTVPIKPRLYQPVGSMEDVVSILFFVYEYRQ